MIAFPIPKAFRIRLKYLLTGFYAVWFSALAIQAQDDEPRFDFVSEWNSEEEDPVEIQGSRIQRSTFTFTAVLESTPPALIYDEANPETLLNPDLVTVVAGYIDQDQSGVIPGENTRRYPRDLNEGETYTWDPETLTFTCTTEEAWVVPDTLKSETPYNTFYQFFNPLAYPIFEAESESTIILEDTGFPNERQPSVGLVNFEELQLQASAGVASAMAEIEFNNLRPAPPSQLSTTQLTGTGVVDIGDLQWDGTRFIKPFKVYWDGTGSEVEVNVEHADPISGDFFFKRFLFPISGEGTADTRRSRSLGLKILCWIFRHTDCFLAANLGAWSL